MQCERCESLEFLLRKKYKECEWLGEIINRKDREIDALKAEISKLMPYKTRADNAYDKTVLNGGSGNCFSEGIAGKCGTDCAAYGSMADCPADAGRDDAKQEG